MSQTNPTPATTESAKPAAPKPEKVKKVAEKKAAKKVTKKAEKPVRTTTDLPAGERRITLVKAMRAMKATSAAAARPVAELSAKTGYSNYEVYGLISGNAGKAGSNPRCLLATGFVRVSQLPPDSGRGKGYYLTKRGTTTKFDEVPFVRESAKAE